MLRWGPQGSRNIFNGNTEIINMRKRARKAHVKRPRRTAKKKHGKKAHGKAAKKFKHQIKKDVLEFRDVFLENRSLKTIITSAIEVYNRETNGALLGRYSIHHIKGRKVKLISVKEIYPFQMEERKPSQVEHANTAAFKRFIRATDTMRNEIIGGYHSHPVPYDKVRLSKGDIVSIREDIEEMEKLGQDRVKRGWLEVLLSITRKEYKKTHRPDWYICDYMKKLRVRVRTRKTMGYDIIISAYWVYPKRQKDLTEKKPTKWNMGVKEVAVYAPWSPC